MTAPQTTPQAAAQSAPSTPVTAPSATPQAAVIIPHYNDPARLERCLAALAPQMHPGIEAVVVDNGSLVDPAPLVARYPGMTLLHEDEKGAAAARNRGVAGTTAPRLFFLDCDCVPAADWLDTALAVCDRADLVGGSLAVFDETPPPRSGAEAFEAVFAFDNRRYIQDKGFSVTANLLTRRAVFDAVGGFRGGLSEDLDWCHRAVAAGHTLVHAPELRVAHPARSDWQALARKWRRLTDEAWGLQGRGPAARFRWSLRALAMPLSAVLHLGKVLRTNHLNSRYERVACATTLLKIRCNRCAWMLAQSFGIR